MTIGMIERGKRRILAPGREERLLPYDRLYLIGTDEQIASVLPILEANQEDTEPYPSEQYGLDMVELTEESPHVGKPIRDSGIRERIQGLIVGIERDGKRILNPDSTLPLRSGDLVWLVGDRNRIRELRTKS